MEEPTIEPTIEPTPIVESHSDTYKSMLDGIAGIDKTHYLYNKYNSLEDLYNGYKNLSALNVKKSEGLKLDSLDSPERIIEKHREFSGVESQDSFNSEVLAIENSFLDDKQFSTLRESLYDRGLSTAQAKAVFDSLEDLNESSNASGKDEIDTLKADWESKIREQHPDLKSSNLSVQKAMEALSEEDVSSLTDLSSNPAVYNLLKAFGETRGESTSPYGSASKLNAGDLKAENTLLIQKISTEDNPGEKAMLTKKLQANVRLLKNS